MLDILERKYIKNTAILRKKNLLGKFIVNMAFSNIDVFVVKTSFSFFVEMFEAKKSKV